VPSTSPLRQLAVVTGLIALLTACGGGEPAIEVGEARAATPAGGASQVVVDVVNRGDGADTLVGVETPAAAAVEIHRTVVEEGRATMTELEELEIPAGETIRFRPGSLHLMLVVPDETVAEGGTFPLTLRFDHSGTRTVEVEVVPLADLADDALVE
jgi:periplasmic copper chaperone A